MQEYKIVSQSDSFWSDRFSPAALEDELNNLAGDGWSVVTMATTEFTGLGGLGTRRHDLFVLLTRPVGQRPPEAPRERTIFEDGYDEDRVPRRPFYAQLDDTDSAKLLVTKGVITKAHIERAVFLKGKYGGHICDHLLGIGATDVATMQAVLLDSSY